MHASLSRGSISWFSAIPFQLSQLSNRFRISHLISVITPALRVAHDSFAIV